MKVWKELLGEIKSELKKIENSLEGIDNRIGLIELIRALDHVFVVVSFILDRDSEDEQFLKWNKLFEVQSTGIYPALNLFLNESVEQEGFPLFPTNNKLQKWVHSCLVNSGNIGYLISFLELARSEIVSLTKISDKEILIKAPSENTSYELLEKMDIEWLQKKFIVEEEVISVKGVKEELEKSVRVWREHYIAYDSSPLLDDYYKECGKRYSKWLAGADNFSSSSTFGGIPYREYKKVLTALIGWSLKHKDCCTTLINRKKNKINPWNIYSLAVRKDDLVKDISHWTGIEERKADKVLDVLTLTPENKNFFADYPGGPPPPFIKISEQHLYRSIAGTLSNPYFFMNRMLRKSFKKDYSKAVNEREEQFRNDLYGLFQAKHILKCNTPVFLKSGGKKVTDIDAMLFDTHSCSLLLVQLKWMEPFGRNMRERFSKSKNFVERAEKWIDSVIHWRERNNPYNLLSNFEDLKEKNEIQEVQLLIIGRYYSYFSGQNIDQRAAWSSWYQIKRLSLESPDIFHSLSEFYKCIIQNSTCEKKLPLDIEDEHINVGKYAVTITNKPPSN